MESGGVKGEGQGVCHHMLALLLSAHYNVSVTDVSCSWNKPSVRADKNTGSTVENLFSCAHPEYSALKSPPSDEDLDRFYRTGGMCGEGAAGFMWLLSPEPASNEDPFEVPVIKDVLSSEAYKNSTDKHYFLTQCLALSVDKIKITAEKTTGQSTNHLWLKIREGRITASNFGIILNSKRKPSTSLLSKLCDSKDLSGIHAVAWGRDNESVAIQLFEREKGVQVIPTGIWLHESGVLGASPDGLVGDDAILEVKCPYSYRHSSSLEKTLTGNKDYFISFNPKTKEWSYKKSHIYFHQVQGQLAILNRDHCHFMVWTPNDHVCLTIPKDPSWLKNLSKLVDFHSEFVVPYLISQLEHGTNNNA